MDEKIHFEKWEGFDVEVEELENHTEKDIILTNNFYDINEDKVQLFSNLFEIKNKWYVIVFGNLKVSTYCPEKDDSIGSTVSHRTYFKEGITAEEIEAICEETRSKVYEETKGLIRQAENFLSNIGAKLRVERVA